MNELKRRLAKKGIVVAINSLIGGLIGGPAGIAVGVISTLDSDPIMAATDWIIKRQDEKDAAEQPVEQPAEQQ